MLMIGALKRKFAFPYSSCRAQQLVLAEAVAGSVFRYDPEDHAFDFLIQKGVKGRFHLSDVLRVLFNELRDCLPVQQASCPCCQMVHLLSVSEVSINSSCFDPFDF